MHVRSVSNPSSNPSVWPYIQLSIRIHSEACQSDTVICCNCVFKRKTSVVPASEPVALESNSVSLKASFPSIAFHSSSPSSERRLPIAFLRRPVSIVISRALLREGPPKEVKRGGREEESASLPNPWRRALRRPAPPPRPRPNGSMAGGTLSCGLCARGLLFSSNTRSRFRS